MNTHAQHSEHNDKTPTTDRSGPVEGDRSATATIPPKPDAPPTVHEEPTNKDADGETDLAQLFKAKLAKVKDKVVALRGKTKEGEKTEDPSEGYHSKGDPEKDRYSEGDTQEKESSEKENKLTKKSFKKRSRPYLVPAVLAWVVPPTLPGSVYDRIVLISGTPSWMPRSEYLENGGEPASWDLLHGMARWMRDTTQMAWETNQVSTALVAALAGFLPLVMMEIADFLDKWHEVAGKIVRGAAGGGAVLFAFFLWNPELWEIHLGALAAAAWYGRRIAKQLEPGLWQFIFLTPFTALITGSLAYTPGAAF